VGINPISVLPELNFDIFLPVIKMEGDILLDKKNFAP